MVLTLVLLLGGMSALADSTITVQGVGIVQVDADRVSFSIGVREVASEVMTAQSAVNEKIGAVIDAMKALGIEDDAISTNSIGIYPNYNYDSNDGSEIVSGYTAYNNISVTVKDVANSGKYIDAAFAAGANSLDYVEFSAADIEAASDRALELAVSNATDKAKVLAEAAGLKLGEVLEIREGSGASYDVPTLYAKNEMDAGAGTEVLASKQSVSASVTMTFAAAH
jgi:hypothetical protein